MRKAEWMFAILMGAMLVFVAWKLWQDFHKPQPDYYRQYWSLEECQMKCINESLP